MLNVTINALKYFGTVFAIGFTLGIVRVVLLVPRLGERSAELMELPWMLVATFVVARWLFPATEAVGFSLRERAAIGSLALALLLATELGVVFFVRGESLGKYFAGRDPIAGTFYLVSLLVFAAMQWLLAFNVKGYRSTETHRNNINRNLRT